MTVVAAACSDAIGGSSPNRGTVKKGKPDLRKKGARAFSFPFSAHIYQTLSVPEPRLQHTTLAPTP